MMKRSFGIFHLISGIYSPISCRRKIFVFLGILIRLEHRCSTALYVLVVAAEISFFCACNPNGAKRRKAICKTHKFLNICIFILIS
ncbi:Uncharacterised protein [Segatella copri]|nr:Uncharacterised protein [Segatella copri]